MVIQNAFLDKVVLITGAAAGIGEAAARAFAAHGAKVVLTDIDERGEQVAQDLCTQGHNAVFQDCDVSNNGSVTALFSFIQDSFGRLDIAFNNAGIDIESGKLADGSEDVFDKIMDVNVKGVWLCMQHEIQSMLKTGGGAIVNTASVAGLGAAPKMSIYAASKHAVVGLTKSAAVEYAKKGIRVNAICPAVIDTNMYRRAIAGDEKKAHMIGSMHPVGRVGTVEEVVSAVLYLSSDAAGFTTGATLPVDGGSTAI
ncbi:SDR family oxidoreductase [Paraglaciecola arctica]|uniref:Bacilysin biosynthesis oxidoreductase BacC n=1 Tax=Paraglaciecola arctica BSs20135 TaxID=493475 RepID=K6Z9T7_9ALTE|nr:SDR family oxidoreductase [Paraglaciecola arctica]GAC20210.1 bacilysin biosynthesis oxidoreductase BacC [Paraglaciecola arctica BSs20135]